MSLNGLDDPTVIDAYQTALAEAGGWFLLKYVSRDEVSLLGRGTGGVPDVRTTVEGYEGKSPLYGFLHYRRRKVVLKFVPEGISRLVQARTTVQFQSILDRFSPQDTVFSFVVSTDLTESALSSACLLHTASGSMTSSSSSLRRRRLMEIAEDAEEGGIIGRKELPSSSPWSHSQTADKRNSQLSDATAVPGDVGETPVVDDPPQSTQDHHDSRADAISVRSVPQNNSLDQLSHEPHEPHEPRQSSQSMRPSLQDLDFAASYHQKVKLGPRPSVDINGRPRTAGSISRTQEHRPIAALPAGVRSSSRKSHAVTARPKSQSDGPAPSIASLRGAPPVPLLIPPPTLNITRPQLSPGAKSMTAVPSSGMSPEKQRLMKALELRKKQMEKRTKELQKKQEQMKLANGKAKEDIDDNKENIDHTQNTKIAGRSGHVEINMARQTNLLPPAQAVAEIDLNPEHDTKPSSPGSSKPKSAVEVISVHSDITQETTSPITPVNSVLQKFSDEPTPTVTKSKDIEDVQQEQPDGLVIKDESQETSDSSAFQEVDGECPVNKSQSAELSEAQFTVESEKEQIFKVTSEAPIAPEAISLPDTDSEVPQPRSETENNTIAPDAKKFTKELKTKRIALLEPIHVPSPDFSDEDNLLSDDSFMEELKSATVQEAKPVSVGKSPLSPDGELQTPLEAWKNSRAVSNPSVVGSEIHALPVGGRSVSATHVDDEQIRPVPVLVAKKVNVSSGISKRIKALEMFSNSRETSSGSSPSLTAGNPTPSASSFEKFRKRASLSISGGPSSASATTTSSSKPTPYVSPSPSPETTSKGPSLSNHDFHSRSKKNSVSVTARIVRDPNTTSVDQTTNPSEPVALNLQRSPLKVERDPSEAVSAPSSIANKSEPPSLSISPENSRRSSIATTIPRPDSRSSSRSKMDEKLSRSTSDLASSPEGKRESRKSRLMRRMSTLTSPRKSVMNTPTSTPLPENPLASPEKEEDLCPEPPQAVDIGEVNVQFPDTLLWKRRFLRIDDQGYLILTPGNVDTSVRNIVKRYHLSEFKAPCLPDEDRQELPNSILLDFRDGSTLQCACESRKGQAAVLQTLIDAHTAYRPTA